MDRIEPKIGKDVIESLTLGMYEDSRFIYREYIQNSADQIDKAICNGLISEQEGTIYIFIDQDKRKIIIEDNATGIPQKEFLPILQNIAQSTKIRGKDKGFRGIGRLGGLAYCQKLTFESSYFGEDQKSIMIWDAATLKGIINNREVKEEAVDVLKKITEHKIEDELSQSHFFRVILENVTNEELLNIPNVRRYLEMVVPIEFKTSFIFKSEICSFLKNKNINLDVYKIYVNGEQIFKGYNTYVYESSKDGRKNRVDEVIDIRTIYEFNEKDELLFWGWYSITERNQKMNQINYQRGFRLRKANIQIGDEYALSKLFKEERFNHYFFGEIHAVHQDLIPNARRDYFIENQTLCEFENKLKAHFVKISKFCYQCSEVNSVRKSLQDYPQKIDEIKKKEGIGFIDKNDAKKTEEELIKIKDEYLRAQKKIAKMKTDYENDLENPIISILKRLENEQNLGKNNINVETNKFEIDVVKPKYLTDNLSRLNKYERKLVSKIFSIINDVLDEKTARNLIKKIEESLK